MKFMVWFGLLLALAPTSLWAETQEKIEQSKYEFEYDDRECRRAAYFAKMLMWQRQHNWSVVDSLNWVDEQIRTRPDLIMESDPALIHAIRMAYITTTRQVYSYPVEILEYEKHRVITEFELERYEGCTGTLVR
ncbi:hypothetical protein [Eikenella corrodens]|uniref:hypothetical protein n=1 Tax=Eikenella corrodens TaxID=539 RepID=UPI00129AC1EB|nr:hypothetical protein [Eikenella corrodens]DAK56041.1 MAG TPA: hypothetical protein [Caudoviricetes sp.]